MIDKQPMFDLIKAKQMEGVSRVPFGDLNKVLEDAEAIFVTVMAHPASNAPGVSESMFPDLETSHEAFNRISEPEIHILLKGPAGDVRANEDDKKIIFYGSRDKKRFVNQIYAPKPFDYSKNVFYREHGLNDAVSQGIGDTAIWFKDKAIRDGVHWQNYYSEIVNKEMELSYSMFFNEVTIVSPDLYANPCYAMLIEMLCGIEA